MELREDTTCQLVRETPLLIRDFCIFSKKKTISIFNALDVFLRKIFIRPISIDPYKQFCLNFVVNFAHTRFIGLVITRTYCSYCYSNTTNLESPKIGEHKHLLGEERPPAPP